MRHLLMLVGLISLCVSVPQIAFSQQAQSKFSCRISLDISATDKIKGEISSYMGRELRSLGDVVITDADPDLKVEILALEIHGGGSSSLGYAFSVVVSRPLDSHTLDLLASIYPNKEDGRFVRDIYADYQKTVSHFVQTAPSSNLSLICKKIVATIDSDAIESERKSWQASQDYLKKNPQLKRKTPK